MKQLDFMNNTSQASRQIPIECNSNEEPEAKRLKPNSSTDAPDVVKALKAKIASIIAMHPENLFQDTFRLVPSSNEHPSFVMRKIGEKREFGVIQTKIGEGTFSTVHKVHILGSKQVLAFKRVKNITDPDDLINIKNEYLIRSKVCLGEGRRGLPNPPYGQVHTLPTATQAGTLLGLITEIYEEDYHVKIHAQKNLPLNFSQIEEEFKDIVSSVLNLHELGHAHRDLKAANFLCKEGKVHMADFGNGKAFAIIDKVDDCDIVRGSAYTLPEDEDKLIDLSNALYDLENPEDDDSSEPNQITSMKNRIIDLNKSMDVFATGTILYERCYFGRRPYQGKNPRCDFPKAFNEQTGAPIPIPNNDTRILPLGLKELIHQMLSHEPENRPTAKEAFDRLQEMFNV